MIGERLRVVAARRLKDAKSIGRPTVDTPESQAQVLRHRFGQVRFRIALSKAIVYQQSVLPPEGRDPRRDQTRIHATTEEQHGVSAGARFDQDFVQLPANHFRLLIDPKRSVVIGGPRPCFQTAGVPHFQAVHLDNPSASRHETNDVARETQGRNHAPN